MAVARRTLPDLSGLDGDALRALILLQQEELASRDTEIENLKLLVLKLKRMQFGRKSEKLDKQIEQLTAPGRSGSQPVGSPTFVIPDRTYSNSEQACAEAITRGVAARGGNLSSPAGMLSGLRRETAASWRRCVQDTGVRSGAIQSDPAGTSEAELQRL